MSKASKHKVTPAQREKRREAQFAALHQRAAETVPGARHGHIQGIDISNQEEKYEPLLFAIESGLIEVYVERGRLPIDDEAERALRLLIARFEGDTDRHSGSRDVDALADRANRNIELLFRRSPLLSRAEIIGCLRRVIASIRTWHTPENPRAYFEWVIDFAQAREQAARPGSEGTLTTTGLWTPGEARQQQQQAPSRPGGLWLPGDAV